MKNSRIVTYIPVIVAISIIAGIFLGARIINSSLLNQQNPSFLKAVRNDKVSDVIQYIQRDYVDLVDQGRLEKDAIIGMLDKLDPHSQYIAAEEFNEVNEPLLGAFEGIGIQFRMEKDSCTVIQTIPGGPSEKAGILAGDRIVTINDSLVAKQKLADRDIMKMLKGEKGTKVRVGVYRRGNQALIPFTITRNVIPTFSIDATFMADSETGYIKLGKFSTTSHQELLTSIESLRGAGMKKLIIDLRGNSGGYLQTAIKIADEFLDDQKLIVYTEGMNRPRQMAYATSKGIFQTDPLVVLVDEGSASASEIIAGAIQDNDRGLVLGRRSFGKGLVQEQLNLRDGSAIRLTIARYYTPAGRSIQKPYNNGSQDYYSESYHRLETGELEHADSIHFNDSLKYQTLSGRTVYGGGGIMPDIFIPIERDDKMSYFNEVANKGILFRYAFEYLDDHRQALGRFTSIESFITGFNITESMLRDFVLFAERNGVKPNADGFQYSRVRIGEFLKALIARNLFDEKAFYKIFLKTDNAYLKALEVLSNWSRHSPSRVEPTVIPQ